MRSETNYDRAIAIIFIISVGLVFLCCCAAFLFLRDYFNNSGNQEVKQITVEYHSRKEYKEDEELRVRGLALDHVERYLQRIIKNGGAEGIIAGLDLDYKIRVEAAVDLTNNLSLHLLRFIKNAIEDATND